jgi:hypothetical protein
MHQASGLTLIAAVRPLCNVGDKRRSYGTFYSKKKGPLSSMHADMVMV